MDYQSYIENLKDGSVDIFIQGEEDKLSEFLEEAQNPPYPIKIREFDVKESELNPEYKYFIIKCGPLEEELQEGFGAMQSIFIDYWREFKDYRGEFRGFREEFREFAKRTDENFKVLMEKYGEISNKLTEILNTLLEESKKTTKLLETIQEESKETREILLENIKLLKEAVDKLSR